MSQRWIRLNPEPGTRLIDPETGEPPILTSGDSLSWSQTVTFGESGEILFTTSDGLTDDGGEYIEATPHPTDETEEP